MKDEFSSQTILPRAMHVCHGDPAYHLADLRMNAQYAHPTTWTINRKARTGERVVFYFIRPLSAIMATGVLLSDAYRESDRSSEWYNHFLAEIGEIKMLANPLGIKILRREFPAWGWLKIPIKSTVVPVVCVSRFASLLKNSEQDLS